MRFATSTPALHQLRIAAGLTQADLANRSGLTQAAVSLLERGERRADETTITLLAAALDCSQDALTTPVDHLEVVSGLADRGVLA